MTVSLRDVLLAVGYGDASLVGETSGYLILGAADCAIARTESATADSITVTEEGAVKLEGVAADEDYVERALRTLLGQLLQRVRVPSPNLKRVAERRDLRGLRGFVSELEAALVPVNRRAARRALARLCRESQKSAARARTFAAVEDVIPVYEEPIPHEDSPVPLPHAVQAEAFLPVALPIIQPAQVAVVGAPPPVPAVLVPEPTAPTPPAPNNYPTIVQQRAEQVVTRAQRASQFPTVPAKRPLASLDAVVGDYGVQTPVDLGPESFELHEESEQIDAQDYSEPDGFDDDDGFDSFDDFDDFDEDDGFDEEPTRVFAGVAPYASHELGQVAIELTPAPASRRRRSFVQPRRVRTWSEEESLISRCDGTPRRRPSDINELLDHMKVSQMEMSEVYAGLKSLSRVDLSPLAPPVCGSFVDDESRK